MVYGRGRNVHFFHRRRDASYPQGSDDVKKEEERQAAECNIHRAEGLHTARLDACVAPGATRRADNIQCICECVGDDVDAREGGNLPVPVIATPLIRAESLSLWDVVYLVHIWLNVAHGVVYDHDRGDRDHECAEVDHSTREKSCMRAAARGAACLLQPGGRHRRSGLLEDPGGPSSRGREFGDGYSTWYVLLRTDDVNQKSREVVRQHGLIICALIQCTSPTTRYAPALALLIRR